MSLIFLLIEILLHLKRDFHLIFPMLRINCVNDITLSKRNKYEVSFVNKESNNAIINSTSLGKISPLIIRLNLFQIIISHLELNIRR